MLRPAKKRTALLPLFAALCLTAPVGTLLALQESETPPAPAVDGAPPLEAEPPALVPGGVKPLITVRATGDLGGEAVRVEIRDSTGTVVAEGSLPSGGEVSIEMPATKGGPFTVHAAPWPDAVSFSIRVIPGWMTLLPPLLAWRSRKLTRRTAT